MSTQIIVHDLDGRKHVHDAERWRIEDGRLSIHREELPTLVAEYSEWSSVRRSEIAEEKVSVDKRAEFADLVLSRLTDIRVQLSREPVKIILNPEDWRSVYGVVEPASRLGAKLWGKDTQSSHDVPRGLVGLVL